eukprot:GHVR01042060.1.p1 GENE.GHVR01042060.1~~GHVR01042060.1.p1  ORF type:complete len:102 (+),score=18.67 GHVR01042060.1:175-480(+)
MHILYFYFYFNYFFYISIMSYFMFHVYHAHDIKKLQVEIKDGKDGFTVGNADDVAVCLAFVPIGFDFDGTVTIQDGEGIQMLEKKLKILLNDKMTWDVSNT